MNEDALTSAGEVLEACRWTALRDWNREYAPGTPMEDVLPIHVRAVRIAANEFPGGYLDVMVKIVTRRAHESEIYFWKWRRVAGEYQMLS